MFKKALLDELSLQRLRLSPSQISSVRAHGTVHFSPEGGQQFKGRRTRERSGKFVFEGSQLTLKGFRIGILGHVACGDSLKRFCGLAEIVRQNVLTLGLLRPRRVVKGLGVALEKIDNVVSRKDLFVSLCLFAADICFSPAGFLRGAQDFLRTIGEAVDFAKSLGALVVLLKRTINPGEHRLQRDACFLPGFDERPVQSGKQGSRTPRPLEALFNFGEVIKVIFQCYLRWAAERFRS